MSSRVASRRGKPRVREAPRSVDSHGDLAAKFAADYGLSPDDWQEDILDDWLGVRADGRWSAATCGLAVPRQNGKNALLEVRELFGMVGLGEKVLHTAHEVKTARKAFLRISSFFENPRQYPELAALLVGPPRKTNGQEAIYLTNGGSIEFIARSKGSGRGFTVDVLVCDEAQDLTDEELAALLPTISAAPTGNPQVILTGTPPDPSKGQQGEVFTRVRSDAVSKRDKRLAWSDFGAPDGPIPDIEDREKWAQWNPALGIRLATAEVERELKLMSPDAFARERGGWWGDPAVASSTAFGEGCWDACRVTQDEPVVQAIGAAVSWDRLHSSIGSAGLVGKTMIVGALDRRGGTGWLVPELKRIQSERGCSVVVDTHGPIADLIPALEAAGVVLTTMKTSDVIDATHSIFDRVQQQTLAHPGHELLDAAVTVANKRDAGDGKFLWARKKSAGDISMLEAVTLAAWAAGNAPNYDPLASVYGGED